jgi:hypothetical protein
MTGATRKRIIPAKVKGAASRRATIRKATLRIRPKAKIDIARSVRGQHR